MRTTSTIPARLWRLVPAAALLAGLVIAPASTTLGCPAIAGAAPVWDIEDYDNCVENVDMNEDPFIILEALKICCDGSGGVWDERTNKCTAPYPEGTAPPGAGNPLVPDVQPPTVNPPPPMIPTVPVNPPAVG
jgi:hypothetical protein